MIRLVTYNIHRGVGLDDRLDLERIAGVLRAARPDIVCLQEMDVAQPRTRELDFPARFTELLQMQCAFGDNYHFDGGQYGNATLTHLPMEFVENFPLTVQEDAEPRGCLHVRIQTSQGALAVFNTHLSYNDSPRLLQAQEITAHMVGERSLLAGDMNDLDSAPAIQHFKSVLQDSFRPTPISPGHTFPSDAPERRIDYVFTSRDIRIRRSEPLDSPTARIASDHLPWLVEFDLDAQV